MSTIRTMRAGFHARLVAVVAVAAIALGFLQVAPASADTTEVTFSVAAGALAIDNAETTVNLTSVDHTNAGMVISGTLGNITVSDTRNLALGWVASGASSDFTHSNGTDKILTAQATITQASTTVSSTNITTFTGAAATGAGGPIATAVAPGSNEATFAPSMSVIAATGTPTGTYTGTFTSTVV